MFKDNDLDEFINRLIENAINNNNSEQLKKSLTDFKKYLVETKMCSEKNLEKITKIIECSDELIAIKRKIPTFDVMEVFKVAGKDDAIERPKQKKKNTLPSYYPSSKDHRSHYVEGYSSSCGGGSSTYRRC